MKTYCLDTSFLINGWNKHYCIDLFPQIWELTSTAIDSQIAVIPWEVFREVKKQRDELTEWVEQHKHLISRPSEDEQESVRDLLNRIPNLVAQGSTSNAADPWVVAKAMAEGHVVVTYEGPQSNPKSTKPPKITYVCDTMGVDHVTPVDFLRTLSDSK